MDVTLKTRQSIVKTLPAALEAISRTIMDNPPTPICELSEKIAKALGFKVPE